MPESIPLSYFHNLADHKNLIKALNTLKNLLKKDDDQEELGKSIKLLQRIISEQEQSKKLKAEELTELGDLCFHFLETLYAKIFNSMELHTIFNYLALAFAYRVASKGGTLNHLMFPVNAVALTANSLQDKSSLESLYEAITFMVYATNDALKKGPEVEAPDNPWKVLIMNYGIIATRTHEPELMESAYKTLLKYFPNDAPAFFEQAMSEMERLNYPEHVRKVVGRYHEQYS